MGTVMESLKWRKVYKDQTFRDYTVEETGTQGKFKISAIYTDLELEKHMESFGEINGGIFAALSGLLEDPLFVKLSSGKICRLDVTKLPW